MTVNLIPQDELTLDLLAKVLAKMYRHFLNGKKNSKNDAPVEVGEPRPDMSGLDYRNRHLGHATPKRDSAQVEDDCAVAGRSRLMVVSAREGTPS